MAEDEMTISQYDVMVMKNEQAEKVAFRKEWDARVAAASTTKETTTCR